jgi:hypothetical protein
MVQQFLPKETGHEVEVTRLLRMVSGYLLCLEVSYLDVITGGVFHHRQIVALVFTKAGITCCAD